MVMINVVSLDMELENIYDIFDLRMIVNFRFLIFMMGILSVLVNSNKGDNNLDEKIFFI